MAENTKTLQQLRRAICRELKMPFFRRFPNGYAELDSGSTTLKIVDSALTQRDGFWNGSWFYAPDTGDVSLIRSFSSNDNTAYLEVPMAASPSEGDDYELHEIWNAVDLKHFINQAIQEGGRTFPQTVVDETLIIESNKMEYDLSSLTTKPWIIHQVLVEKRGGVARGTLQSATTNTFTVETASILASVSTASTWRVSIYEGTGSGQIRTLSSVASEVGTVTVDWTTVPDSTSKYALWNTANDIYPWVPIDSFRLDSKEYPDTLSMFTRLESIRGMRIRLEYLAEPSTLSAETDTTIVPERFIILKACSLMMGQRSSDVKADKDTYYAEFIRYNDMVTDYIKTNAPHKPDIILKGSQPYFRTSISDGNPMGW